MPYYGTSQDGRYRIVAEQDPHPTNPREWDNFGTMVCWHQHYMLGDEQPKRSAEDWERAFARKLEGDTYEAEIWEREATRQEVWEFINERAIVMPLYLYEHSVVSISTRTFHGRAQHALWDSGQVGWIYVTHEDVEAEYGDLSEESLDRARELLSAEVDTYDMYVRGEVYCVTAKDLWLGALIDSCCGFYASEIADLQRDLKSTFAATWHEAIDALEWHDRELRDTQKSPVLIVIRDGIQSVYASDCQEDIYVIDLGEGACEKLDIEPTWKLDDDALDMYEDYMGRA